MIDRLRSFARRFALVREAVSPEMLAAVASRVSPSRSSAQPAALRTDETRALGARALAEAGAAGDEVADDEVKAAMNEGRAVFRSIRHQQVQIPDKRRPGKTKEADFIRVACVAPKPGAAFRCQTGQAYRIDDHGSIHRLEPGAAVSTGAEAPTRSIAPGRKLSRSERAAAQRAAETDEVKAKRAELVETREKIRQLQRETRANRAAQSALKPEEGTAC